MSDLARQHSCKVFQGLSSMPIVGQLNRPICERCGLSPSDDFRLSPQRSQVGRFAPKPPQKSPYRTAKTTSKFTPKATPKKLNAKITPEITPKIKPKVTPKVTPEITPKRAQKRPKSWQARPLNRPENCRQS